MATESTSQSRSANPLRFDVPNPFLSDTSKRQTISKAVWEEQHKYTPRSLPFVSLQKVHNPMFKSDRLQKPDKRDSARWSVDIEKEKNIGVQNVDGKEGEEGENMEEEHVREVNTSRWTWPLIKKKIGWQARKKTQ